MTIGKRTSWMTIQSGGAANPGAVSEQIPVVTDALSTNPTVSNTQYQATATVMSPVAWSSGTQVVLTFYNSAGTSLASYTSSASGVLNANQEYTLSTAIVRAPASTTSASNTSYALIRVEYLGSPSASNPLRVYDARMLNTSNPSMRPVMNVTSSFSGGLGTWSAENSAVLGAVYDPATSLDGMNDSLLIADSIQILGVPDCAAGGSQSTIPELIDPSTGEGACFRIVTSGGAISPGMSTQGYYDFGTPQPTQDIVESMLLDGERPFGQRSSNRTLTIPVMIFARSLKTMAAARNYLLHQIDQQTFKVTWTPASTGLSSVFDCFRAQPSVVTWGFNNDREAGEGTAYAMTQVTITMQALPYIRSGEDGVESLDFQNGLLDGPAKYNAIQVDNFSTVNSMLPYSDWGHTYNNGGWRQNTSQKPGSGLLITANSAEFQPPSPPWYPWPRAIYSASGLNLNIAGLYTMGFWLGQSYDSSQWKKDPKFVSNVTVHFDLTDDQNRHLTFSVKKNKVPWSSNANKPVWTWVAANFNRNLTTFNYAKVTAYKITMSNWGNGHTTGFVKLKPWINGISIYPGTIAWADEPRSSVYSFRGKTGMARTPLSAEIQLPASAPETVEITKSGTWLVPKGVTQVYAEAWGGGGGGASANTNVSAAGGGGAEYAAEPAMSVIPGSKIPVTIGTPGRGGQLLDTTETYTAPGTHKWVCPPNVTQISAQVWGGGAAGAAGGAGGGGGEYASNPAVPVTPGKTYTWTVGTRGVPNASNRAADRTSRDGGKSQVVGDSTWVTAYGGISPVTGGSSGGSGGNQSLAPVHHAGGRGGASPGAAGGGGGASGGPNGPGATGGSSPAWGANGKYKTGGAGGGGAGNPNSGNGGKGANAPGSPTGGMNPGGGGGGGYTGPEGKNYNGATGGYGKIQITYQVNLGTKLNGGATTFGDVTNGLTNSLLTANGGITPSVNDTVGSAGGSGSTNTIHYNGGQGGPLGSSNELMLPADKSGSLFANQLTSTGTGATFTTSAATSAAATGISVFLLTTSAAMDSTTTVTDSAGNQYELIAQQQMSTNADQLYVFSSAIEFPITTSTTITLTNNSTSFTRVASWMTSQYFHTILKDNIAQNSGSSTTASAAFTNPVSGAVIYEMAVAAIDNATTLSVSPGTPSTSPAATTSFTNGNLKMSIAGKIVPGTTQANSSMTGTLGASAPWAMMNLPFAAVNQAGTVMPVANGSSASGTTVAVSLANTFGLDANSGVVLVAVSTATAGTSTVADNASGGSNTYTSWATVSSGGQHTLFYSKLTKQLTTSNTITVTTPSGAAAVDVMFVPGATAVDTSSAKTTTGSGTAVSASSNGAHLTAQIAVAMFGNNSSGTYSGPAANWNRADNQTSSTLSNAVYFTYQRLTSAVTASATQSVSGAWGAIVGTVTIPTISGAGGSSGGPNGVGLTGIGGAGGPAWSGGGKGADGVTSSDTDGGNAALPGGGGSGASSLDGTPDTGGYGGAGMVRITWQPPLRTFNDFIIHRPAADSRAKFLDPVVDVGPYDPPDNREYPVASTVTGASAQFGGTYTVLLVNHAWASSTQSRRVTVTVNQYEYLNGPVVSAQATKTLTPDNDITNGYVTMGELTLPIKDYDQSVSETYYTVSVHSTNQNDRFQDVIFLDTMGQTVLVNIASGTAGDGRYSTYYVDEPDFDRALGKILGTGAQRDRAVSVMDSALATGGPLYLDSGENQILVYSTYGAPNLGITYSPRWFSDRLS